MTRRSYVKNSRAKNNHNTKIIPKINIKKALPKIKKRGFIKSKRKGDTGVGYTLEYILGIKENNKRNHDFTYQSKLVEAKAQRIGTSSDLTLFTKEPSIRIFKDVQLMKKYGYVDKKRRLALKDTCVYQQFNQRGLRLQVSISRKFIEIRDKKKNLVWRWLSKDIVFKFRNLLLVFASRRIKKGREYFHYEKAYYLQNFNEKRFLKLIRDKVLVIDLRMHLKSNGKSRNRGTAFRIRDVPKLKNCYKKVERIL